jgi:hypothetical protein
LKEDRERERKREREREREKERDTQRGVRGINYPYWPPCVGGLPYRSCDYGSKG